MKYTERLLFGATYNDGFICIDSDAIFTFKFFLEIYFKWFQYYILNSEFYKFSYFLRNKDYNEMHAKFLF